MSLGNNKDIVRRYYEEVVNKGMYEVAHELIGEEYEEVYQNKRYRCGVDGAIAHVLGVRQTYADLHLTIKRQIAEGEWGVTSVTARGTHLGTWMGMCPTGKALEFSAVNLDRVMKGTIVEHSVAANLLELLLAAGAIRPVSTR